MTDDDASDHVLCAIYTHARRHPMVLGHIAGWTPPFQLTLPQLVVIVTFVVEMQTWRLWGRYLPRTLGIVVAVVPPVRAGMGVSRARFEGRTLARAAVGYVALSAPPARPVRGRPYRSPGRVDLGRHVTSSSRGRPVVKPPARAIVGHLVWSTDGGVWAVWRVTPFAHAHTRSPTSWRCTPASAACSSACPASRCCCRCASGSTPGTSSPTCSTASTSRTRAWADVCAATGDWLGQVDAVRAPLLPGRRAADRPARLARGAPGRAAPTCTATFGSARRRSPANGGRRCAGARPGSSRSAWRRSVPLRPVDGRARLCWLYARALRRAVGRAGLRRPRGSRPTPAAAGSRRPEASAGGPAASSPTSPTRS